MDRRLSRESSSKEHKLQRKLAEKRHSQPEPVPDITDFMNDWFFGSADKERKTYNLTGGDFMDDEDKMSPRDNNSKLTQEWLEEAKRMVASSPSRCESPTRLVGSPRFATVQSKESLSLLDRRDPLSRSARRHRTVESYSGEILSKSAKHGRNRSEIFEPTIAVEKSPASAVQQWFSNILKSSHTPSSDPKQQQQQIHHDSSEDDQPDSPKGVPATQSKPPRQPTHRKSRFQNDSSATATQPSAGILVQSRRTFRAPVIESDNQLLSPPKNLIESVHRRSISSSTCSLSENQVLSPPRNLVESAHRRSISSSSCSLNNKQSSRPDSSERSKEADAGAPDLNGFLREQKAKIRKISNGESSAKAKIVLSGSSNSTSSMVAAICNAWLLENRIRENKEDNDGTRAVVAPVMNMTRGGMWKQRQAAWLFHHVGIDATAFLFSDEVDLESLMMARQLNILVIGLDVLKENSEVASQCTILTDNYCEDAYDLLQIPTLKKLLLAGILLDTQNLNISAKFSMNRDAEAVQLLLVGSAPNYRNALFDQLTQDHQHDGSFLEAMRYNYGKPPNESGDKNGAPVDDKNSVRKSSTSQHETTQQTSYKNSRDVKGLKTNTVSPKSAKANPLPAPAAAPESSRGKNKNFLAKWFGFGSK